MVSLEGLNTGRDSYACGYAHKEIVAYAILPTSILLEGCCWSCTGNSGFCFVPSLLKNKYHFQLVRLQTYL